MKPMMAAMSAEDLENQLQEQQQQHHQHNKVPHDVDDHDDEKPVDDLDDEALNMEPVNITPELKPDPREFVDEDPNAAPEWDNDDDADDAAMMEQPFQFGILDKEQDRAHFKKTGDLPSEVTTISHQEYQRRKEQQDAARDNTEGQV